MSRRFKKEEMDTGSDSFLDIIANIVGILIILIVIAGVRVSQLPGDAVQEAPVVEQLPEPESAEDEIEAEPVLIVEAELGHAEELPSEEILPREIVAPIVEVAEEPEPPRPPQPSPQLLAEITLLEQNIRNLRADAAGFKPQLEKTMLSKRETEEELSATQKKMEQHLNQMTFVEAQLKERKQEMKDDMTHLTLLANEIEARKTPPSNIKNLTHKLTPVSEVVEGDEFHFRLENNRVSYIPLNQLIDQLKSNILPLAWLAKSRSHHGSVGPIGKDIACVIWSNASPSQLLKNCKTAQGCFAWVSQPGKSN